MSLERFKTAQQGKTAGFATALAELQAGHKSSHWIWYIFPQLAGLGRSSTAQYYGVRDLAEAVAFLRDPVLSERLAQVAETVAVHLQRGAKLDDLMGGSTDALKLVSSLTLFELALRELGAAGDVPAVSRLGVAGAAVLAEAERQGYPRCRYTLEHAG